jgi:type IV pilus assembly protein PilC
MEVHDFAVAIENVKEPSKKQRPQPAVFKNDALKINQLCLFAQSLSRLLEGGVPILKALDGLEKAVTGPDFKKMLIDLQNHIRRGVGLSEALERSRSFPTYFYQTVYAGEVSGGVPGVLAEIAQYMEKEQKLRRGIRDALVYPAFIVGVGFVTITVLLCFVLPKLRGIYDGFDTQLPVITTVILGLSKIFLPVAIFLTTLAVFLVLSMKKKGSFNRILYKTPFIGEFFKEFVRVRFSRLLSLLLESGIPVLEALDVVEKTFDDAFLKKDINLLKESLAAGGGFSDCLDDVEWIDSLSRMLVVSGEETGRLGASFFKIARDTEIALETRTHLLVKLLEPALILLIGVSVGFVVIGTVLPIFDMSSIVQ